MHLSLSHNFICKHDLEVPITAISKISTQMALPCSQLSQSHVFVYVPCNRASMTPPSWSSSALRTRSSWQQRSCPSGRLRGLWRRTSSPYQTRCTSSRSPSAWCWSSGPGTTRGPSPCCHWLGPLLPVREPLSKKTAMQLLYQVQFCF